MKEIVKMFGRRYSAVSTNDNPVDLSVLKSHRSLQSNRTLSQGFSIVDSFFYKRKEGKRTRTPKRIFLLMAAGVMAICLAIAVHIFQPYFLIFKWKLIFEDDGEIFNLWAKPPVDLYIKVYLFNITNPDEFMAGTEKLNVQELGPYVYRELISHDNVTFNKNGTLTTYPQHPLVWQEHLSEGNSEDDLLMVPNIALLSIAQVTSSRSYFFRLPVNVVIRQTESQPIVQMTAKEFMFGYESTLTTLGNTLMPDWISFEKVGIIDRMYDFDGDYETIFTGETNPALAGLFDTFRGSTNLPQWEGDHCSKISGASDGTKFKSFIEPNDTLYFYRKSMCRPQTMVQTGNETIINGLTAQKFVFAENALDNGYYDENNKCYCREDNCMARGLIDVTECYYGFPIALSYPHFLDGHPELINNITGVNPNKTQHQTYFMIQPLSGMPLKLAVKFQINLALSDINNMAHVGQFSNLVVPMLWFEITMFELPEPLQNRFNLYLNILPAMEKCFFWGCLIGGILFLLIAVIRGTLSLSSTKINKISKNQKFNTITRSGVYKPCEEKFLESENNCIRVKDDFCDIELINERNYKLELEPALSDIDDNTDDRSSDDQSSWIDDLNTELKIVEDTIFNICENNDIPDKWELGEASSSIDDIGNNNFNSKEILNNNNKNNIHNDSDSSISITLDYNGK